MKSLLVATLFAMVGGTGCAVTVDGIWEWPIWIDNWSPAVISADAGCGWDPGARTVVWYFEAEVDDYDGLSDIDTVEAHVYDGWRGDRWVDGFALEPTIDPWIWYVELPEWSTALDCYYAGYIVDFYVWDWFGDFDTLTVRPWTY